MDVSVIIVNYNTRDLTLDCIKSIKEKTQDLNDAMADTNKKMSWLMPIMSISIAMVAPLGLALYWLMNNILMIFERLVLNKIIKEEGE